MEYRYVDSPLGRLVLAGHGETVIQLIHPRPEDPWQPPLEWHERPAALQRAARELDEYFAGRRQRFDLDLEPRGTEFQRRVWAVLRTIPYGTTWSYAQLAAAIGQPTASRAVGTANGRNPLPIFIPCHRVIAADGGLGGFGWGLDAKARLLAIERQRAA